MFCYNINHNSKGFTLIELMIVLLIASIIAGIVVNNSGSRLDTAKCTNTGKELYEVMRAYMVYYERNQSLPSNLSDLPITSADNLKNAYGFDYYSVLISSGGQDKRVDVYTIVPPSPDTIATCVASNAPGSWIQTVNGEKRVYVSFSLMNNFDNSTSTIGVSNAIDYGDNIADHTIFQKKYFYQE